MKFGWESEKERLLKYMKMPLKAKLEWLEEMNEFFYKFSSKKTKLIRRKLKESR